MGWKRFLGVPSSGRGVLRGLGFRPVRSVRGALRRAGLGAPASLAGWLRTVGRTSRAPRQHHAPGALDHDYVAPETMRCAGCGFAGAPYDPENIPPCPNCGGFMSTADPNTRWTFIKAGLLLVAGLVALAAAQMDRSRPRSEPTVVVAPGR